MKNELNNNEIKKNDMQKYTQEELLEMLPSSLQESKELTTKQKVVLGQLIVYNGLDITQKLNGCFFRSNKDLYNDCGIEENTLITAVNKLVMLGFIERKRGSRRDGASLYKVNMELIKNYSNTQVDNNCKKEIEDDSNDYSKQMAEMANRIKDLEITIKMLVEKITVIEGGNYSTDIDIEIDKEIEKEKEIKNINILNKVFLNNNKEESENIKQLEIAESPIALEEFQASSPIEDLSQVSIVTDSTDVEGTQTSTEDEQYRQWLQVLNPYLKELEDAKTLKQFDDIKIRLKRYGGEYLDCHEDTSPTVIEKMNKVLGTALKSKKSELIPDEMELSEYVSRIKKYGSL